MAEKFKFAPLKQTKKSTTSEEKRSNRKVKIAAEVPGDLHNHLLSYCFYNHSTHQEVVLQALQDFLKDKENKPLPEKLKDRPRPGRKAKSNNS